MIHTSNAFINEIKKPVNSPQGKIAVEGLSAEITDKDYLQSFTVERYDNEEGKLFGNAVSRRIEAVFIDNGFEKPDFTDKKITAYTGYGGEYVNFTPCYVSDAMYDEVSHIWTLTAYDVLGEFNKYTLDAFYKEYPDIDFTTETLGSFADKVVAFVSEQSGYDIALSDEGFFNSGLILGAKPNFGGSENLRTVLGQIAECGLCNCIVNRSGQIEFRSAFKTSSVCTVDPATYFELSRGDSFGTVNSLVLKRLPYEDNVYAQDTASIQSDGLCELFIADNAFLDDKRESVVGPMLSHIKGYAYINAYYLDWKGCAALDTSDLITIKGLESSGDIVTMFYGETFTYDGSTSSVSELNLPEDSRTDYASARNAALYDRLKNAEIKVDKVEGRIDSIVSETLPVVQKSYIVDLSANMYAVNTDSGGNPVTGGSFDVTVTVRLGDAEVTGFGISTTNSYPGLSVAVRNNAITFSWTTEEIQPVSRYTFLITVDDVIIAKEISILATKNGEVPYIQGGTWHIGGEDTGVKADYSDDIDVLRGNMSEQYTKIRQEAEQLALEAVKEYAGTDANGNRISLSEFVTQTIKSDSTLFEYQKAVEGLQGSVDERFKDLQAYLRWGTLNESGNEVGLEMGVSDSEIKVRLVNDKLVFYTGSFKGTDADNVIQCIDAKTSSAKLGNTLQYGDEWEHGVDSEGNFYHAWIGD